MLKLSETSALTLPGERVPAAPPFLPDPVCCSCCWYLQPLPDLLVPSFTFLALPKLYGVRDLASFITAVDT